MSRRRCFARENEEPSVQGTLSCPEWSSEHGVLRPELGDRWYTNGMNPDQSPLSRKFWMRNWGELIGVSQKTPLSSYAARLGGQRQNGGHHREDGPVKWERGDGGEDWVMEMEVKTSLTLCGLGNWAWGPLRKSREMTQPESRCPRTQTSWTPILTLYLPFLT